MLHEINLIVAMDERLGIGKDGKIPWPRLKADLANFKKLTTGYPIVMGRVTAESIGKPLPNRENIVLTSRQEVPGFEACSLASSISSALDFARRTGKDKVWIIGGEEVYRSTQAMADRFYITRVSGNYQCDRFYEDTPGFDLRLESYTQFPVEHGVSSALYVYRRTAEKAG